MTAQREPAVSVVMSVLDGEAHVGEAVESVLAQTFADWELVVVDDGSTDGTGAILDGYAARDPRILVVHRPNAGRPAALNEGIARARGPLIARLDADDVALPRRLELQLARLAAEPALGVVGGAVVFVTADGRPFAETRYPLDDRAIRAALGTTTPFVHSAVTMRRAAFEAAGGYRPAFVEAEDLDLWLRIPHAFGLANLADPVVRYRIHGGQATMRHLERQARAAAAARASARHQPHIPSISARERSVSGGSQ
jgi:glycosyltransferase involved in cell wall biosynthesis